MWKLCIARRCEPSGHTSEKQKESHKCPVGLPLPTSKLLGFIALGLLGPTLGLPLPTSTSLGFIALGRLGPTLGRPLPTSESLGFKTLGLLDILACISIWMFVPAGGKGCQPSSLGLLRLREQLAHGRAHF